MTNSLTASLLAAQELYANVIRNINAANCTLIVPGEAWDR